MQLKIVLKKLIQENGMTVSALAERTGVSPQTLHNWMSGAEPRSLNQVKKVADCLEVSVDYLCFGIKAEEKTRIEEFDNEINAGVFEVVLRRVKRN